MRGLSISSLLLTGVALVQAKTVKYEFDLAHRTVSPDGFNRSAVTINGITPGPVLKANKGDDFQVYVKNGLSDHSMRLSTTIHWHGIFQPRTAYDDGPAFVTQCPIGPGHDYHYRIETSDQTGTYWYHSHLSSQYIDGLRGAIVIYDPEDPHKDLYDVDDDNTIITLTDWYHESAATLATDWVAFKIPEPVPDSNLLNGVGRYKGGPEVERVVISVVKGKRYRFRLINMSAIVPFNFAVEGHSLTVIAADAVPHEPLTVSSLSISAGQRYSVVLNANQEVANYWIAYPSNFRVTVTPGANDIYNGTEAFAVLRYEGAPAEDPKTPQITPDDSNALKEYKLKPLVCPPPPVEPPFVVNLTFFPTEGGNLTTPGGANKWLVNGVQYTSPAIPTLLEILSNPDKTNQSSFMGEDVYVLPINKSIEVIMMGDSDHPFHLHGHVFQVVQSAEGPRNEIDPPIRDTVNTNNGDTTTEIGPVTIRFRTDNPGPWFLHCHKDWHLEAGLAVVFAEDPEDQRRGPLSIKPSPEWQQLCKIYNGLPKDDK